MSGRFNARRTLEEKQRRDFIWYNSCANLLRMATRNASQSLHSVQAVWRDLSQNEELSSNGIFNGTQGQNRSGWFGIPTPSPATALRPAQGADVSAVRRDLSQNKVLSSKKIVNGAQGQNRTADTGIFSPRNTFSDL